MRNWLQQLGLFKQFKAALIQHPALSRALLLVLAGLLTFVLMGLFKAPFNSLEEQIGAFAWRINPDTTLEERINIVAIDEKSIEQLGPWPWPRETMAELAQALDSAGVQLQLYDIVFPEQKQGDEVFLEALESSSVVLSQVPVLQSDEAIQTGLLTHPMSGITCNASTNIANVSSAQSFVANNAVFASIAKGHIATKVDSDGGVRQVPAFVCVDGQAYPALAISAMLLATGSTNWQASLGAGSGFLGSQQYFELYDYPGFGIPLDAEGNMRVSFKKAPEAFRAFSAIDIINGEIGSDLLDNTMVLVGYTAFGLVDIVPTPFNGVAPGVEVQARILSSYIDSSIPYTPAIAPYLLALLSVLFGLVLFGLACKQEKVGVYSIAICSLLLPALAFTLHIQLLSANNIWLGWFAPSLYSIVAAGFLVLHDYARVKLEKGRVFNNLSSYLPEAVAKEIAYSLPNSSIKAHRENLTLLSADLRNFSAYGESRPPEESAALLHFFFVRATEIIEQHQGQVHEFKGDALLATWGTSNEKAASQALAAAISMQRAIEDLLPATLPQALEPLALGIGIEQGPVLLGSIGPAHRRSHTMLGETVTIALRIQEMTADLAQPILLGECVARQLSGNNLQSQGSYLLSGLQTPHTLFAPRYSGQAGTEKTDTPSLKLLHGGRMEAGR